MCWKISANRVVYRNCAVSSVGRAIRLHRKGQGFESLTAHPLFTISITDLIILGTHGATKKEKANPQRFQVDIWLKCDGRQAPITDDLSDAIDYRIVKKAIEEVIGGPFCQLMETLADRIANLTLERTPASQVTVQVTKLDIWPSGQPAVMVTKDR